MSDTDFADWFFHVNNPLFLDALAEVIMPSKTEKQQRFMGAELARKREGKATKTGMSEKELEEFARKPTGGKKRR